MKVHQIKIDFNVTEQIKRFVYVYILEAEALRLFELKQLKKKEKHKGH